MKVKNIAYAIVVLSFVLFGSSFKSYEVTQSPSDEVLAQSKKKDFAEFLSKFEKVELPYAIELDELRSFTGIEPFSNLNRSVTVYQINKNKLSKKGKEKKSYAQFLPSLASRNFSRVGGLIHFPICRFYLDDETIAVVYKTKEGINFGNFLDYNIITYDLKGNIVSITAESRSPNSLIIGGVRGMKSTSFSIDEHGIISTKEYKHIWEKDIKKFGYRDNNIAEYTLENINTYKLQKNGWIKKIANPIKEDKLVLNAKKDRC